MFSWLFGTRQPERVSVRDRVWLTTDARARAIGKELAEHVAAGRPVLLLAHFPSTLAALAPEVLGAGFSHEPVSDGLTPQAALKLVTDSEPRMLFGLVRNLKPGKFPVAQDAPLCPLPVLLAERHFLRRHDDLVTQFAEGLGTSPRVTVHVALDDELMKLFVGQWVTDMLKKLGMKDDEAVESTMVMRRIRKAQDKIRANLATDEAPADSPLEWIRQNART